MNSEIKQKITDYLNNLLEMDTRCWWPDHIKPTNDEINLRRLNIINNPKQAIYSAIRRVGESRLGVNDSLYDAFPQGLVRITLRFVGKLLDNNQCTLRELIPDLSVYEEDTPAAFPRMLALFASEWLTREDRWRTKQYKKLIAYYNYMRKQKQS